MKKSRDSKRQHSMGELKSLNILIWGMKYLLGISFSLTGKKQYFMKLADIPGTNVTN